MHRWLKAQTPSTLREAGERGLEVIEKEYSKDIVTGQYLRLIENLCK